MLDLTDHMLRKAYSLSLNEYAVLCEIYFLSRNNKYGGWCIKSRQNMADTLDITKDTIQRCVNKLVDIGLVEKNAETKFVRTTDKWNSIISSRGGYALKIQTEEEMLSTVNQTENQSPYPENHTVAAKSVTPQTENQSPLAAKSVTKYNIKYKQENINNNKLLLCPSVGSNEPHPGNPGDRQVKEIFSFYEEKFDTKLLVKSPTRVQKARARLKSFNLEQIKQAIVNFSNSPFHRGDNQNGWKADIDFIIRSDEQIEKGLKLKATAPPPVLSDEELRRRLRDFNPVTI